MIREYSGFSAGVGLEDGRKEEMLDEGVDGTDDDH
jgi:hypothetical protein